MLEDRRSTAFKLKSHGTKKANLWIDLENSPHVPFFAPIIRELELRGYSVVLTARDCFQVCDLIKLFKMPCLVIGHHYGKLKLAKVAGTLFRGLQLVSIARGQNIDLAISHGSRSQLVASSLLGIQSVFLGDYEFSSGLKVIQPDWLMIPAVIPNSAVSMSRDRVLKYPGIKEDVYVPGFRPDPGLRGQLGLGEDDLVITVRPPANEAHYHNPESDKLYHEAIDFLASQAGTKIVLLPRNEKQGSAARELWPALFAGGKMMIPEHAVDGLNLLWNSDLAVSGGGTMNREAAALGIPVYSVFRGKIGAVDHHLAQTGRLVLLESVEDVHERIVVRKRIRKNATASHHSNTLRTIIDNIVDIIETGNPDQRKAA